MSLNDFLTSATRFDGAAIVVGFIMAFLLEWVPGWDALAPKPKRALTMELSFLVPLLAGLCLGFQGPDGVFVCLVAGFGAFFGSQGGHATMLPKR